MARIRARLKADAIKKIKIIASALFFCLFAYTQSALAGSLLDFFKKAASSKVNSALIQGYVSEQNTRNKISGAYIKITSFTGRQIALAFTNSSGNYSLTVGASGVYIIICSASGYQSVTSVRYTVKGTNVLNLTLKPVAPVENTPPKITAISPSNRSTLIAGDSLKFSVTATDAEKDALSYRYSIDDKVIKDWSSSSSYYYATGVKDRGRHKIKVEVKDSKGASVSEQRDIYIFRPMPKP